MGGENRMIKYVLAWYTVLSVIAFLFYGADKRKAKKRRWRTPESVLLFLGCFGGAVGALLGMNLFRHKTKHLSFWAVNLLGLSWQIGLVIYLI